MNKDRVFIGYNKYEKRCLLYKKDDHSYIDLETKESYDAKQILKKTLINYDKLVKLSGYSSKSKIKKKYELEEEKTIDLKNVFIGSIFEVTDIIKTNYNGDNIINFSVDQKYHAKLVSKNHILIKHGYNSYVDLITNDIYGDKMIVEVEDLIVDDQRDGLIPFNMIINEHSHKLSKRKVLKKYQDKYGLNSYK